MEEGGCLSPTPRKKGGEIVQGDCPMGICLGEYVRRGGFVRDILQP